MAKHARDDVKRETVFLCRVCLGAVGVLTGACRDCGAMPPHVIVSIPAGANPFNAVERASLAVRLGAAIDRNAMCPTAIVTKASAVRDGTCGC